MTRQRRRQDDAPRIAVRLGDPGAPEAVGLLRASHALMRRMFAPEENHFLSIDALRAPDIRFFLAETQGRALGCAALVLNPGYGEVKSMFVASAARGSGAADALMTRIETEARAQALPLLRLETGTGLDAALAFYARHGFARRGPFGAYTANATSIFMEKALT